MGRTRVVWGGNNAAVIIEFDDHDRACEKTWIDAPESLRGRLLQYVPWIEKLIA